MTRPDASRGGGHQVLHVASGIMHTAARTVGDQVLHVASGMMHPAASNGPGDQVLHAATDVTRPTAARRQGPRHWQRGAHRVVAGTGWPRERERGTAWKDL